MQTEDVTLIAEVSTMRASAGRSLYQNNLTSALNHLEACKPPPVAYCLHITNQETKTTPFNSALTEQWERLELGDQRLVPMPIHSAVTCVMKLAKKPRLTAEEMHEWLHTLHTGFKAGKSPELATEEFLENRMESGERPIPEEPDDSSTPKKSKKPAPFSGMGPGTG